MVDPIAIYDLDNIYFLENDIDSILSVINALYLVQTEEGNLVFQPKTVVRKEEFWFSDACKIAFNQLVPIAKSLTKDMYAVIETIHKGKYHQFSKQDLEKKYRYLREFRLLNNKFKHFNNQQAEISLTQTVMMAPEGNLVGIWCNFKYENRFESLPFSAFIELFLVILKDSEVITIS